MVFDPNYVPQTLHVSLTYSQVFLPMVERWAKQHYVKASQELGIGLEIKVKMYHELGWLSDAEPKEVKKVFSRDSLIVVHTGQTASGAMVARDLAVKGDARIILIYGEYGFRESWEKICEMGTDLGKCPEMPPLNPQAQFSFLYESSSDSKGLSFFDYLVKVKGPVREYLENLVKLRGILDV